MAQQEQDIPTFKGKTTFVKRHMTGEFEKKYVASNLYIFPLATIENFVTQKCLLPKGKFPLTARPGQWAKCYFHEKLDENIKQNYAVCQIFPREEDEDTVCYLDTCVCNVHNNEGVQMKFYEVVALKDEVTELKVINVLFSINTEYYINNATSITKSYLTDLAQILLQKYHLTKTCIIQDTDLKKNGVDSIAIHIDDDDFEENVHFIITDDTFVNIENVLLTSKSTIGDLIPLKVPTFIEAHRDLDDLMEVVRMQRSHKQRFYISLNILIVGPVGCGKTTLVEDFLSHHRCNIFRISTANAMKQYPGETEAELRKIFKAACHFEKKFKSKEPTVILLEDLHLLCPQTKLSGNNSEALANSMRTTAQLLSLVDDLFKSRTEIICLATTSNPDNLNELVRRPGRFEREIYIGALQENERTTIFKELFKQAIPNNDIPPLLQKIVSKQTQGYVIADLALLMRNIAQVVLTKERVNLELIVRESLKKSKPISLKGSDVTAYRTMETFASIGGMHELKKILEVSILAGLKQQEAFLRFGLSLPKGVLLYGPPGCAKTTIAKCLATEANMTFIATSGAEVYSPYVGCAEKFIAKIFDTARKNSPCLIFLDEIDSLVGRRSLGTSSNSSEVQMRILSTLLTEMDGVISAPAYMAHNSHILVVAATNRPDMVDDALMRPGRFDKLIHVPAPDLLSRRSILDLHKQRMPFAKNIDLEKIAACTDNYSGADICNLCNEAAMQAFQRDFNSIEILNEDFENVLTTLKSSLTQGQIQWHYQFENKFLR